jgi:hypothetical protein
MSNLPRGQATRRITASGIKVSPKLGFVPAKARRRQVRKRISFFKPLRLSDFAGDIPNFRCGFGADLAGSVICNRPAKWAY